MRLDAYEVSLKKQFVLKQLAKHGVTHVDGLPVAQVDYEDLKRELAILRYKQIDVDNSENAWF